MRATTSSVPGFTVRTVAAADFPNGTRHEVVRESDGAVVATLEYGPESIAFTDEQIADLRAEATKIGATDSAKRQRLQQMADDADVLKNGTRV